MKHEEILNTIKKWKINKNPEYRGLRCAKCRRTMRKAWHVWLNHDGYKVEVHFCNKCGKELKIK